MIALKLLRNEAPWCCSRQSEAGISLISRSMRLRPLLPATTSIRGYAYRATRTAVTASMARYRHGILLGVLYTIDTAQGIGMSPTPVPRRYSCCLPGAPLPRKHDLWKQTRSQPDEMIARCPPASRFVNAGELFGNRGCRRQPVEQPCQLRGEHRQIGG